MLLRDKDWNLGKNAKFWDLALVFDFWAVFFRLTPGSNADQPLA